MVALVDTDADAEDVRGGSATAAPTTADVSGAVTEAEVVGGAGDPPANAFLATVLSGELPVASSSSAVAAAAAAAAEDPTTVPLSVVAAVADGGSGAAAAGGGGSVAAAAASVVTASGGEEPPPAAPAPVNKSRCNLKACNKKLGLTGFECRCKGWYCGTHRHADQHPCTFDWAGDGRAKNASKLTAGKWCVVRLCTRARSRSYWPVYLTRPPPHPLPFQRRGQAG